MATEAQKIAYKPKPCRGCRDIFQPQFSSSHYCVKCRTLICLQCGKKEIRATIQNNDTLRFCSRTCAGKWNMRKIWADPAYRNKMVARGKTFGAKVLTARNKVESLHGRWKGDAVGYSGVHSWVDKHGGRPKICKNCGSNDKKKRYEWANISGKYFRRVSDFIRLCVPCHRRWDMGIIQIKIGANV